MARIKNPRQYREYEASLKLARDSYSITQTIRNEKKREREEGRAEGMAQGRAEGMAQQLLENVRNLISAGFDFNKVVEMLKIPAEKIDELREMLEK
jgi:flagellar biosynthesis/type III secretory pathway protein FliH